jgi:hypothetical protein
MHRQLNNDKCQQIQHTANTHHIVLVDEDFIFSKNVEISERSLFSGDYNSKVSSSYTAKLILSVYRGTRIMLLQHGTRRVLYVCNWHVNLSEKRGNGDQDHENVIEEAYE